MSLFTRSQRQRAQLLSRLAFTNPFLPERIELEQQILGDDFQPGGPVWSVEPSNTAESQNYVRIAEVTRDLVEQVHKKLESAKAASGDLALYSDLAHYHLFDEYRERLNSVIEAAHAKPVAATVSWSEDFFRDADRLFTPYEKLAQQQIDRSHLLACLFQVRRAFFHVFLFIAGRSVVAAQLRASVWQSIFTHDMRRYQRTLYRNMGDATTFITGPSGTGKELVARAIGLSRYIPFDAKKGRFAGSFVDTFYPVNLSALSPTLIESELFGHCKGSFTGAVGDRVGWLEQCEPHGTVFLDEIGEVDMAIQVKLLRVLQTRSFNRLGETTERRFAGKVIAATNRDIHAEIRAERFREDLYYRLCADRIQTPSLRQQLDDCPEDLSYLLMFIAERIAPDEAESLASEVADWIDRNLGPHYPWPGNVRELEQCFRNVLIHGEYQPASSFAAETTGIGDAIERGHVTADELVGIYCQKVYEECGSYEQTARRLGLDRRTVKRKIEQLKDAVTTS